MIFFTVNDYLKRFFIDFVLVFKKTILYSLMAMLVVAITNALQAYMLKPALDEIFVNKNEYFLFVLPILIFVIGIIKAISSYFQNYYLKFLSQRISVNMQEKLFNHLIFSDLEFILKNNSGKLIAKFSNDIFIIKNSLSNTLTNIARELTSLVFLIIVMLILDLRLSIFTIFVIPMIVVPIIKIGQKMRKISRSSQDKMEDYISNLDDTFLSMRTVKTFATEAIEIKKASKILEEIFQFYEKAIRTESVTSPLIELITGVVIALTIFFGGWETINGKTSPGTFFAFIAVLIAAYKPLKNLSDFNNIVQEGIAALSRYYKIIDIKPKIISSKNAKKLQLNKGIIEFKNVSFSYNNKSILNELSFTFPNRKIIAIVGLSGGGKSTILNLIERFYDTTHGTIAIDNQDIKKVDIKSLREQVSIVTQEVLLFDDTIANNISYSKPNATETEIVEAAKLSDIHEFIISLKDGYNTNVGPRGAKLSGGQRQKISLARALLKNPPILLLDEATSSVDNISEEKIATNIKQFRKNLTTILVAHRTTSILQADHVIVVRNGKIEDSGSHKDLLKKNKYYNNIFKKIKNTNN